ncbi:MAG: hypothetical protein U0271_15260 [Polyangiaceae bacterium]
MFAPTTDPHRRVVWLAAADARGHLTRAHLARGLLARAGIRTDIVTTSEAGRAYLAALGTPSEVLSSHYAVAFDAWQDLARGRTERTIAQYFLMPSRALADARRLDELAAGAAYLVNDFHPLPLVASRSHRRVVHVVGRSLRRAIAHHFDGRGPAILDRGFAELFDRRLESAHGCIEHSFTAPARGVFHGGRFELPPLVSTPRRSRAEVRAALGLARDDKLAAVYLNPNLSAPGLAASLRAALEARGYVVYGVAEGQRGERGFVPYDADFASALFASDLFVAAPGMASSAQARAARVPFVALLTDQPEQRDNARTLATLRSIATVELSDASTRADLRRALDLARELAIERATLVPPTDDAASPALTEAAWTHALVTLASPDRLYRKPFREHRAHTQGATS